MATTAEALDEGIQVDYVAPAMLAEVRRAVALTEAVKLGIRAGWGEEYVLETAARFDKFLEGEAGA